MFTLFNICVFLGKGSQIKIN